MSIKVAINYALELAKKLDSSREVSLVITKLEEALHWLEAAKIKEPEE